MRRTAPLRLLSAALLALAALALPARGGADWLVTTEGGRVETRGPWEVKGKLVVFTTAGGALSSLRATQVDLEASRRATVESKQALVEAEKAPPEVPRKSVRSITDKDFSHPEAKPADAKPADAKSPDGTPASAAGKPAETTGKSPIAVGTWQKVDRKEKDGIDIIGTVNNGSSDLQTDVGMTVALMDDAGGTLGTARAMLTTDSITGKGSTDFKASFPGVFTFARAKFDIQSAGLKLAVAPSASPNTPGASPNANGQANGAVKPPGSR